MKLSVTPATFPAGSSAVLRVSVEAGESAPGEAVVLKNGAELLRLKLSPTDSYTYLAGLTLITPGTYTAKVGELTQDFGITPQTTVPFHFEMLLLAGSVIAILGGLIRWQMQKQKNNFKEPSS